MDETTNNSPLRTAIAVNTYAQVTRGDHRATMRQLARFTTEALIDAAQIMVSGMTSDERDHFGPYERITNRDNAVSAICSVVHSQRMRDFKQEMDRAVAAATRELPEALEDLAASL